MPDDTTYNGWKNSETWAAGLYLDGNYDGPGTYYETIERVKIALEQDHPTSEYWTVAQSRRYMVADTLKEWVEENTVPHTVDDDHPDPELHPFVSDLYTTALSRVDWNELADTWIENISEQDDPDLVAMDEGIRLIEGSSSTYGGDDQ